MTNPTDPALDAETTSDADDDDDYDEMLTLDRLESLEEEMTELGVRTLEEVRQRIADLHAALDAAE